MLTKKEIREIEQVTEKYNDLIEKSKLKTGELILKLLNTDYLTEYQTKKIKELIQENKNTLDPFYSQSNLKALDESIKQYEVGKVQEHKLIEVL